MSLQDFITKEYRLAKEQGLRTAIDQATSEVAMKALNPVADYKSTPIWDADFDVCLVLDACRYDLWEEVTSQTIKLNEQTGSKWSVGSASPEWISKTFAPQYDQEVALTGYVTANPFSSKQGSENRFVDQAVYPLESRGFAYLDEVWQDAWPASDELPTVDPATLTARAFWAYKNRDMDKLVVHYMQPHIPFKKQPEWTDGWESTGTFGEPAKNADTKDDWHKVRDGEIPEDEFWNAYVANLEWVLHEVERWIRKTDARILVTSDHGNAMGEYGQWGHPPGSANPALRKVPWVSVDGANMQPINDSEVEQPPQTSDSDSIDEQLAALGYK
jgi:hypothetical protein